MQNLENAQNNTSQKSSLYSKQQSHKNAYRPRNYLFPIFLPQDKDYIQVNLKSLTVHYFRQQFYQTNITINTTAQTKTAAKVDLGM